MKSPSSLKDEIKKYLVFLEHYDYLDEEIEKRTDDIIKIFEKRIEELLNLPVGEHIGVPSEFYNSGFDDGLTRLKKEILK